MLPVVAFPRSVLRLVLALVGQLDEQPPASQAEVQVEVFPSRTDAHPPLVVVHLFQVNGSARGNNLIKSRPTIPQYALGADLESAVIPFPDEIVMLGIAHN